MKISDKLYQELRDATRANINFVRPDTNTTSNYAMRQRWDALWFAVDNGRFDINKLYAEGLNDGHIDSALRRIQTNS